MNKKIAANEKINLEIKKSLIYSGFLNSNFWYRGKKEKELYWDKSWLINENG